MLTPVKDWTLSISPTMLVEDHLRWNSAFVLNSSSVMTSRINTIRVKRAARTRLIGTLQLHHTILINVDMAKLCCGNCKHERRRKLPTLSSTTWPPTPAANPYKTWNTYTITTFDQSSMSTRIRRDVLAHILLSCFPASYFPWSLQGPRALYPLEPGTNLRDVTLAPDRVECR